MPERATQQEMAQFIVHVAKEADFDPLLAVSIVKAESDFTNVCNRTYGCIAGIGPFQIVRSTFKQFCNGDVFNPEDNIRCGVKILKESGHHHWDMSAFGERGWLKLYTKLVITESHIRLLGKNLLAYK